MRVSPRGHVIYWSRTDVGIERTVMSKLMAQMNMYLRAKLTDQQI